MGRLFISCSLKERAKGYCEYCLIHSSFAPAPFSVDHIYPESQGGTLVLANLAFACGGCNGHKFTRINFMDPLTQKTVRLYNPRQDDWNKHFEWNTDSTLILGKTPIGRATIQLLQINREGNINLRSVLQLFGVHPPSDYP